MGMFLHITFSYIQKARMPFFCKKRIRAFYVKETVITSGSPKRTNYCWLFFTFAFLYLA